MTKKNENCDQKYLTKSLRIGTDQLSNTIEKKIKIVSFSRQVINYVRDMDYDSHFKNVNIN